VKKAPRSAGVVSLLLGVAIYGLLMWQASSIAFLNRIGITFVALLAVLAVMTLLRPLKVPFTLPVQKDFDMRPAPALKWLGPLVIAMTLALYIIFW
jgi:uncharacterized sodium:solute symporter family permease YidK